MAERHSLNDPEIEASLAEIEAARQRLGSAIQELRETVDPLDWRKWVARHPVESTVGAAVAGFILAQPGLGKRNGFGGSFLGELIRGSLGSVVPHILRLFL
jgi:hypothetical protein